jgi:type III pantothenate kinase
LCIGTVVPRALHNLEVLAAKYFHVEPLVAGQGAAAWPMTLDVDEPQNVGADRALNVIAAHAKYPGDKVIIDFGTATTFDVADASGAYKGGIIAPGINLSIDALVNAAAMLPRIAIEAPEDSKVIGRTAELMPGCPAFSSSSPMSRVFMTFQSLTLTISKTRSPLPGVSGASSGV